MMIMMTMILGLIFWSNYWSIKKTNQEQSEKECSTVDGKKIQMLLTDYKDSLGDLTNALEVRINTATNIRMVVAGTYTFEIPDTKENRNKLASGPRQLTLKGDNIDAGRQLTRLGGPTGWCESCG